MRTPCEESAAIYGQQTLQRCNCSVEARASLGVLPPTFTQCITLLDVALWFHAQPNNFEEIWRVLSNFAWVVTWNYSVTRHLALSELSIRTSSLTKIATQGKVKEIDYVAMIRVAGFCIKFVTTNVGKDAIGIASIRLNQPAHLCNTLRLSPSGRRIIEGKAHAEND